MLYKLIDTFEELKEYVFIIDRGSKKNIIFRFKNENFFHLVGLQHANILMFIPDYIKTKDKQYKHIKKYIDKYNDIIENQIKEKDSLRLRMETFVYIIDLLNGYKTNLFDTKEKNDGSLIDGEYGLLKIYEDIYCFLGLKIDYEKEERICCVPQTWFSDRKAYKRVVGKRPLYFNNISKVTKDLYNDRI